MKSAEPGGQAGKWLAADCLRHTCLILEQQHQLMLQQQASGDLVIAGTPRGC